MKVIEFYIREIYGIEHGYILDPKDAKLVLELTGSSVGLRGQDSNLRPTA